MAKTRYYVAGDGKKYRLIEAMTPFNIEVFRSHCPAATIGDPGNCLIAMGARKHRNVIACYIGSGKDAYVIMRTPNEDVAVHFTINANAAKVRDAFETNKKLQTQIVELSIPTQGRTLEHRSVLNKKRRLEVKAGATVKKQANPGVTRVQRLGVPNRPRAKIVDNVVTVAAKKANGAALN